MAEEMEVDDATQKAQNLKYCVRIANYMFGGRAGHPFLRHMLEAMSEKATLEVKTQQEILDVTGLVFSQTPIGTIRNHILTLHYCVTKDVM